MDSQPSKRVHLPARRPDRVTQPPGPRSVLIRPGRRLQPRQLVLRGRDPRHRHLPAADNPVYRPGRPKLRNQLPGEPRHLSLRGPQPFEPRMPLPRAHQEPCPGSDGRHQYREEHPHAGGDRALVRRLRCFAGSRSCRWRRRRRRRRRLHRRSRHSDDRRRDRSRLLRRLGRPRWPSARRVRRLARRTRRPRRL